MITTHMRLVAIIFLAAAVAVSAELWNSAFRWETYKTYPSPYGTYSIEISRRIVPIAFPGQSGDTNGKISLMRNGRETRTTQVELASSLDAPVWTKTTVSIYAVIDWQLE